VPSPRRQLKDASLEFSECLPRGFDRFLNLLLSMGEAYEPGLELAWGEVDAVFEHGVEKRAESDAITGGGLREVDDPGAGGLHEKRRQHRPDAIDGNGHLMLRRRFEQAGFEHGASFFQRFVAAGLFEDLQRLDTRAHRQRVAAQCARLIYRTGG